MIRKLKEITLTIGLTLLIISLPLGLMGCNNNGQEKEEDKQEEKKWDWDLGDGYGMNLDSPEWSNIQKTIVINEDFCINFPCTFDDMCKHRNKSIDYQGEEYKKLYLLGKEFDHDAIKAKTIQFHEDQHIGLK